ncbi:hypothetical protein GGI12_002320 [Dipsacomyces acuminosporus]|nr:hypothetical protein GGI12_002320 [Dipsacomyces acuminosporus]
MFPDIPEAAIRADLARTGSPAVTSDNILRNGGTLPMPPEARNSLPLGRARHSAADTRASGASQSAVAVAATTGASADSPTAATSSGISLNASQSPLVNRMRINKDSDAEPLPPVPPKIWESDADKRADVLRKRKEFMLIEARKRFLEKQGKSGDGAGEPASSSSNPTSQP